MNNDLLFFLPMNPPTVTHQMKKVRIEKGKPRFYEPAEVRNTRARFMAFLAKHAPDEPFEGPLELSTGWFYAAAGKHDPGDYKTTKPDTDNMIKLLKDCMTATRFWKDDAQVAVETTIKVWNDIPGIMIGVKKLDGNYGESLQSLQEE